MPQNTDKVIDPLSTYDVIELIGTSTESWEDAAKNVIEQAGGDCLAHAKKEAPRKWGPFWSFARLVIAYAIVIATPPIGASGDEGLSAQPPAIVVGVVIGTVNPDPHAIHEYPMTMMEAVKVVVAVVALSKATITVTMVVAAVAIEGLVVSVTEIAPRPGAIEVAASRSMAAGLSEIASAATRSGFGESATTAASGEPSAAATATVARDGMTATPTAGAHSAAVATATATAAAKSTPAAMAHEDEGTVIGGTHSVL
jgi:hypothetical protein